MTFRAFVEKHYRHAREEQTKIERDLKMIEMFRSGTFDADLVHAWMSRYGILRNVNGAGRDRVFEAIESYWSLARKRGWLAPKRGTLARDDVRTRFAELFVHLYQAKPRNWTSATSKILWCMHPRHVVLYDRFVVTALTALQYLDPSLRGTERIGAPHTPESEKDIELSVDHYMRVFTCVRELALAYRTVLLAERSKTQRALPYAYEIRILDKLLVYIGNPSWEPGRGSDLQAE